MIRTTDHDTLQIIDLGLNPDDTSNERERL